MIAAPPKASNHPTPLLASAHAQPTPTNGATSTVAQLLTQLRALDIHLWLEADRLRYNAPKGAMSPDLVAQLRQHKEAIVTFLRDSRQVETHGETVIIPRTTRNQPLPLAFAQERLWLLDQLEGGEGAAYNMAAAFHLQGKLNVTALTQALGELVRRHEILRTTFPLLDGQPVQLIASDVEVTLALHCLQALPAAQGELEAKNLLHDAATMPFDLATGPLLRVALLKLAEEEHLLSLTMHHIIADGWSIKVMIAELSALYNAFCQGQPSPLPELAIQYADFADWQRQWLQGERLERELAFWKEELGAAPPLLELPTYQPRLPVQRFRGARLRARLDADLTQQLRALSQQHGATLAMTTLAAFNILLARYSGQEEIVVGMPIANRNHADIEPLIGFFLNTLLIRSDLADNPSFGDLLARVRQKTVDAYSHQDLPFVKLAEALQPNRTLSYNPLFQVLFLYQGAGNPQIELPGLQVTPVESEVVPLKDDLVLEVEEQDGALHVTWEYDLDLFQPAFMHRFSAHFEALLRAIVANPAQPVLQLPMLSPHERRQLLVDWNNTETYLDPNVTFLRRFEAQVAQRPAAIAVTYLEQRLTYGELNACAEQMATHLTARGVGAETIVAIFARRSPDFLVSILAIFKAGGAYLPIDLRSPAARIAQILQQSGTPLLLTTPEFTEILDETFAQIPTDQQPTVLLLDDLRTTPISPSTLHTPPSARAHSALAYVIYTSGSTGTPKGAMVEQRGMLNHLFAKIKDLQLSANDVVAQNASQSFVVSVWQFLAALVVGGAVHILPDEVAGAPQQLLLECAERGVTILEVVPSLLRSLLDGLQFHVPALPTLRWLVPTGEQLVPALVQQWFLHYPQVPLLNAYGSTECSDDVAHAPIYVSPGNNVLKMPIGKPVVNTRLYILDRFLQPVPVGVAGELYVAGVAVGRGYRNDPARTAHVFLSNPFSNEPDARLYKTGDKARYLPDGNIEYLGRVDFQVKIRGFRIELGEVEATLAKHPAVAQTVVTALEDSQGNQQLVAYVVHTTGSTVTEASLRQFVAEHLPSYMVPAAMMALPAMPLNHSGKIDRKALSRPDFAGSAATYVAPQNDTERQLAAIWQEVLEIERVSVESSFFDLGGHSLLATQVIARIRRQFEVELPLRTLFETPTIRALARYIAQSQPLEQLPPLLPVERMGDLPLSFAQQRLWFIDQLEGAGSGYVISGVLRLQGKLDRQALQVSLNAVVARQESLRTTFAIIDGQPVQRIASHATLALPTVDLRHLPASERLARCQELVFAEMQRPFVLTEGPLLRTTLYQLDGDDFVLAVDMHHIISDGWSIGVLSSEILEHYRQQVSGQPARLPELTVQVADYAQWQRAWLQGETVQSQLDYWKTQLAAAPALLELPTDRPRTSTPSFRSDSIPFALSAPLTQQLNQIGQQQGATLYMTLLAAFALLLARHSGQEDLVIGSPIANRTAQEVEALIGFFVNTLAMRITLQDNPDFSELLRQVRQTTLDAYAHQDLPFEQVVDALHLPRHLSQTPLFQVIFAWQSASQSALFQNVEGSIAGLEIEVLRWKQPAVEFDLVLNLEETAHGVEGSWEFSTDLFERSTVERLVRHFQTLLAAIAANPQQPVAALPIFDSDELATLTVSGPTIPLGTKPATIDQAFEAQVARTPQAMAVLCGQESLTYATLNRRANQLAHYLRAQGIGRGDYVAICMEACLEKVVAVVGVIKAGAAYLPLDPAYPPERLQTMLEDAAATFLLTQAELLAEESSLSAILRKQTALPTLALDTAWSDLIEQPTSNGAALIDPADPFYLIYTSGSTGTPKGVVVPHRGMINTVYAMSQAIDFQPGDRFLQFAPFGFDVHAMQFFTTLAQGATLVVAPRVTQLSIRELMELCDRQAINVLDLPVALWHQCVDELRTPGQHYPSAWRVWMTGGEKPSLETLHLWAQLTDQPIRLLCSYGPTEASVTTALFVTANYAVRAQPPDHIPLGEPLPNMRICVLDSHQQPVPIGTPGELCIGGAGLALGYHNQPELTAQKFIELRHPQNESEGQRLYRTGDLVRQLPDGSMEFLGRVDSQVKVRGFRIELGEIETRLKEHLLVSEAVVKLCEPTANDKRIVAYYKARAADLTVTTLRDFLKQKLPAYMLPNAYVALEQWPLTPHGKVDRKALPSPDFSLEGEFVAPRNATEARVATLWAEVLGVESVGVESNFFDLGGHSLLATQIVSRIRQHFAIDLPLRTLMEEPTVAAIAHQLQTIEQTLQLLRPESLVGTCEENSAPHVEVFEL